MRQSEVLARFAGEMAPAANRHFFSFRSPESLSECRLLSFNQTLAKVNHQAASGRLLPTLKDCARRSAVI
jgi:hypothetical protein